MNHISEIPSLGTIAHRVHFIGESNESRANNLSVFRGAVVFDAVGLLEQA